MVDTKLEKVIEISCTSKERILSAAEDNLVRENFPMAASLFFSVGMEEKAREIAVKAEKEMWQPEIIDHQIEQAALYAALGMKKDFLRFAMKHDLSLFGLDLCYFADLVKCYCENPLE